MDAGKETRLPLPKSWQAQHSVHLSVCLWAGAAFGSCLHGWDVVARAARGSRNGGRRSTLEMPLPKSWQAQHSVHLSVCLWAGAAFGSCLHGWDVVARAARGSRNGGRRSTLEMPLPKSWQAQYSVHLSVCLRGRGSIWQLSRGLGCCCARGLGLAKSWQAQHFGDAIAEVVADAAFCASECVFAWQGQHLAAVARAARGSRNGGRRSTLEMPLPKSWQAQYSVHLSVCLRGRGSIWQLSKGLGCCRARGSGLAKSWQPQHFEDAIAEVVAGAAFCASECVFAWQGQHLAAV